MAPNVFPVTCTDCGSPKQYQDMPCPNCGSVRSTVHAAGRAQSFSSGRATAEAITGSLTITLEPASLTAAGTVEVARELTKSDLEKFVPEIDWRSHERPLQRFNTVAKFLDLILEPDKAESTIVNLAELYERRLRADPGHAQRWLFAQVGWIVFGRAMDLFRRFMRARAGK
jgi:hypothetical protein